MVVIERDEAGTPTVWCDPEIVDLVTALNKGGIPTVASCSGHGVNWGNIALRDGRELFIAPDFDAARNFEASGMQLPGKFQLQFFPADQSPTEEGDYILYNQCDGYHFATAYFCDGFDCFMTWNGGVYEPDWYCAWAKLPESHTDLFNLFAKK